MDSIIIKGVSQPLRGRVRISGSKNAALPELFSTILSDDKIVLKNIPSLLADIKTAVSLLEIVGKKVTHRKNKMTSAASCGDSSFEIETDREPSFEIPYDLVRRMRASIILAGPMLSRYGRVRIALPGGCAIGVRPIDIHLEGFKSLGAQVKLTKGYVDIKSGGRLKGGRIKMRFPSVGATENLVLAATLADGKTIIENAAREPEIGDLCRLLVSMGARISGIDSSLIEINGVRHLSSGNKVVEHEVISDRIEAATYMAAAAITRGEVVLENVTNPGHLKCFIGKLEQAGASVRIIDPQKGEVFVGARKKALKPVNVRTAVYPGFPTDLQAQWMALMTQANGVSKITETIFENRFLHVAELKRLGADLEIRGNTVFVKGPSALEGAPVMVSDLRAGAALVLAALASRGTTEILRVYHLDRGYENLAGKLSSLGADISRVPSKSKV